MNSIDPISDPLDQILAEVAINIQLPPSKYNLGVERYQTMCAWVERADSPLCGKVARFYPQGSMAIGTTIAAFGRDEEYDVDLVAELLLPLSTDPKKVLELLFSAIQGVEGSRYYGRCKLRSRCVTVFYSDGMHIDVTPAVRDEYRRERTSAIFHDDPDQPDESSKTILMNAWGFCELFKSNTKDVTNFADAYSARSYAVDSHFDAEAEPVDPQEDPARKSTDVVAQQLIKRARNTSYAERALRRPPSILMAKYASDAARPMSSLSDALLHHLNYLHDQLSEAEERGTLIQECNPTCEEDDFTDRWPMDRSEQRIFLYDIRVFRDAIIDIKASEYDIRQISEKLRQFFGKGAVSSAVRKVQALVGSSTQKAETWHKKGGGIILGSQPLGIHAQSARASTNYGDRLE